MENSAAAPRPDAAVVDRLWQSARFLPHTVRLLGTRYRTLFLAYAQNCAAEGQTAAVADALAFTDFMFTQDRMALLPPELKALKSDAHHLRCKFRLRRSGGTVTAVERWKIAQWLSF